MATDSPLPLPLSTGGRWLRLVRYAWYLLLGVSLGVLIAALPGYWLFVRGDLPAGFAPNQAPLTVVLNGLTGLLSLGVALLSFFLAFLLHRRGTDDRMALILSFYLLAHGTLLAGPLELLEPFLPGVSWFTSFVLLPGVLIPAAYIIFVLFPDGRARPAWSRWLVIGMLLLAPILPLEAMLFARLPLDFGQPIFWLITLLSLVATLLFWGGLLMAQTQSYRTYSSPAQRQQTKWVVLGLAVYLALLATSSIVWIWSLSLPTGTPFPVSLAIGQVVWMVANATIPGALAISVLRYRLFDVDLVINRTLVYGALTFSVVTIYLLVLVIAGSLFHSQGNIITTFLATALIALLFHPLRLRLQATVNRLMFGERDEPYTVLHRLGQRLEGAAAPEAILSLMVDTVAQALRLPFAEIHLFHGGRLESAARTGKPGGDRIRFPLSYQAQTLGYLQVCPRAPGEDLSPADERLLRQIARQAGPVAHAIQLTRDLQASRERLVNTREEERRRLRRDLHDGLGPVLAGQGLKLAALKTLLKRDPAAAVVQLDRLLEQNEATVATVRRLVYGLRPPALDELGLAEAIRDQFLILDQDAVRSSTLQIRVVEPAGGLPPLPAAVEVAAYHIALEALTNVARHADADHCSVKLSLAKHHHRPALRLVIRDDGCGLPSSINRGLGLSSMRQRAEELGGSWDIDTGEGGGTRVVAYLPLPEGSATR